MFGTRTRLTAVLGAVLSCAPVMAVDARTQAWVPGQGEGAVAVAFQSQHVTNHLSATTPAAVGEIDTMVLMTDATYGVTDRIAVDLALPLVTSRYTGTRPHPGTDIDDGRYRSSFTDVRVALRYNLTRNGAVITPYIGTVVPSHDYAFYGHAAPGQQLRELQMGVYAARLFDRALPGLFVAGRYGFGFVEKVLDISHNRSVADLELGYFFSERFRSFVSTNAVYTHGGIDFPINGLAGLPLEYRLNHDQIQKVHHLNAGVGAAFSVTDGLDIFGSYSRLIAGRNGHALDRGLTIGASWSFSRKKSADVITPNAPESAATATAQGRLKGSLLRCICQKSGT